MPIASFQLPNGKIADFEVPEGLSQEEIEQAVAPELRRLVAPPPPPKQEESGFFRQTLDVPIGIAKGAASGVRALSDIFGANNPVSRAISGTEDYLDSLLSAQARNDQQEIARIMKEAEDKGLGAQVAAGVKAFATAPVDFLSQALGSAVPIVAGGLAASVARLGALGVGAVTTGLGAGTGAGIVKGSIYDAVKGALTEAGESPEVAEARAQAAQSYGGENWGQILTGTALGGLVGRTGVEKLLLDRFGKQEVAEQAAKGIGRRAAEGAVTEAVPEIAQAGQEQLAQNIALQRAGFDVPTLRGVAGAATLEGLAGGALGGGLGAISRGAPPEAAPPAEPEAPPAPPVVTNYQTIDQTGNPATISVAQDNTGTIVATGPDGEPVDLSNMVSAGFTIEDSIKSVFSAPEAPVVPAPEAAPAPRVEPEITLPSAPVLQAPSPLKTIEPPFDIAPTKPVEKVPTTPSLEDEIQEQKAEESKLKQEKPTDEFILQNRDRSTPASINQMNSIAANPDYGMVGFSRDFAVGAPVISGSKVPDQLLGKKDYATTSDGRRIPVQYAVVPADTVVTSNNINGAINPLYADQEALAPEQGLRAIAGNGRATGLAEAYRRGTADRYKEELLADDMHGVDPEGIQSIANPVLVRVMPWNKLTADIGDVSNTTGVAGLSAVDQAKTDVSRVDFGTLEFYENGEPTGRAVKTFIQAMPMADQANLIDTNGEPTAQAIDRFNAALFAKAYADEDLIRMFAQAKDPEARLVMSALAQLAPDMARLDGLGALDVRPIFIDAAKIIISGKRKNLSLAKIAQQTDITVNPSTQLVVDLFAKNPRSNRDAIEAIRNVTDFAYQEGTKEAEDIFGAVPKATRDEVLGRLRREDEQAGAEVVEPAEGRGAVEEVAQGAAAEPGAIEPSGIAEEGKPPTTRIEKAAQRIAPQVGDIISRRPLPENMEARVFKTTDGYGVSLYDKDSGNVVSGSVIRYKGADAQAKAEAHAKKLEDETIKPEQGLTAEEKAIADRERELFALQPQTPEKVGAPTGDLFGAEGIQQIRPSAPKPSRVPEGQLNLFNSDKDFVENSSSAVSGRSENIAEAQRVEKALKGKTPIQAAKWMAANATNPDFRLIAKRVVDRMQKLMDAGIPFKLHIVGVGDKVPVRLLSADGLTSSLTNRSEKKVVSVDIWLNNSTVTGRVGTEEKIVLHELIHAVTAGANFLGNLKSMQGTEAAKLFTRLYDVRNAVVRHFNSRVKSVPSDQLTALEKKVYIDGANALKDEDEVLAWGLTDPDMQEYLESIPYKGQTAWSAFVDAIREFLGLPKAKETALSEVLAVSDLLFEAPLVEVGQKEAVKAAPPAKPIANQDQISLFNASVRGEKVKMTPTAEGQAALDTINDLGRQVEETPTMTQKARESWDNATDNPKATIEAAKKKVVRWLDQAETWTFSSDAALNNATRRLIKETTKSEQEKMGILLSISSSQAVHPDALANLFIRYGGLNYDPSIYKYVAVDKKDNFVSLVQGIDTIGAKYGLTKQQAERVSHTAFEAKRLSSIARFNRALKVEIDDLRDMARTASDPTARDLASKEVRRKVKDFKFVHMTDEQIQRGLDLFKTIPELNALVDTWQGIRENSRKELVESGLWSEQEAEGLLSNMDYVPFYREDQLEKGKGPKEFLRNLQVQAKEKKLKGSDKPVADIFDNMARWTQYAVKRSVMNRLALAKIDAAVEMKIAKKVEKQTQGDNSVRVWRNGKAEYYSLDDPLFMDAFTGLESVAIPSLKYAAKVSNWLRQSVVLYPLFSVSQVPQDAFAAMFSSGLKPRFALTIPARAVKEFVKTLLKSSQTHKELERIGVVGIRDFTAAIAREDAEIYAGLKARPGVVNKVKNFLEHIAMSSDNAVRQAVYEASIAQGVSRAEALEKAFNLINFRNRGSSKGLAAAGQVIPFFNAYLAAQHVAYRTISGVGISPTERKAALGTLAATTASVMTLSLIYAMMVGDDEDYLNKPSVMRDRLFMIPGTGLSIPIRSDIFSIPKIITEHTYMLMTDNGASDGRKFRDSMKAALGNALFSPTVVPQAIKPLVEVGINYNFFQGRPLVGTYQKGLETERQFNDSTSELAKLFGQTGVISPIAADHLIRGMLGSVGGLTLYMTNFALHNDPSVPRPAMSIREAAAALPGTSGFLTKEYETALKNDFYVLRDEVSTAVNTLNDLKKRSPHEIEEFLADETNLTRVGMAKAVNRITKNLTDIRRSISQITASNQMSASEKAEQIRELKAIEREILQNVDLKSLRKMANL